MGRQHLQLHLPLRIAQRNAEQETVELAFRQGIRPLELDRVLRGNHHERPRQRMGLAVGRHLPLAHRLQQGALRARRGAVDLVGQHNVGEDRAGTEDKLLRLAVVQTAAGDVGGQEVGRELDAMELAGQAAGDGLAHQRLAHPGDVLQEHVFPGQQRHHGQPHGVGLPSTTREMFCCNRSISSAASFGIRPVSAGCRTMTRAGRSRKPAFFATVGQTFLSALEVSAGMADRNVCPRTFVTAATCRRRRGGRSTYPQDGREPAARRRQSWRPGSPKG